MAFYLKRTSQLGKNLSPLHRFQPDQSQGLQSCSTPDHYPAPKTDPILPGIERNLANYHTNSPHKEKYQILSTRIDRL